MHSLQYCAMLVVVYLGLVCMYEVFSSLVCFACHLLCIYNACDVVVPGASEL